MRNRKLAVLMASAVALTSTFVAPAAEAGSASVDVADYYVNIGNAETGKYLSTMGFDNGSKVVQWGYDGAEDQYWKFVKKVDVQGENDDRYWIVNSASHRCAGISGGGQSNGAPAVIWDCNEDAWANYWFVRLDWIENGVPVYRLKNVWSGKCLAIPGGNTQNGTQAIQWDCINDPDQQWTAR
ncbi:ricin-type beta-trefoil lectin protein [Kribbella sp. VKM Ac-2571]|uniref:RICIN domain-containing protein n=1 Tax=Kribbella sp. VKM Ac-2571 TaxID=2512222 RepID=UPI00106232FC|nr:RICIN domain-containing protein [Kribbella sp. VKM Ac-2571]TDO56631.1 ricin-type beta-trefoil lectin protein [Kribbella sp. VKM Ac-2571]